jgi:hypothetical protein
MESQAKYVKIQFDQWLHSTMKAHLFRMNGNEFWLPK